MKPTNSFNSPWLEFERPTWESLRGNSECEIAIIGGGISGVATLYYLLTETDKRVALFEQDQIASGASGNNAGLACIHIERPIHDLAETFGLEITRQTFTELEQSWDEMLAILDKIGAKESLIPLPNVSLAMTSTNILKDHAKREKFNRAFGRTNWQYYIVDDPQIKQNIPVELAQYVKYLTKADILKILHSVDDEYIGIAVPIDQTKIARLNSAKFCYQIINYLTEHYADRFFIYENTGILSIEEHADAIHLIHAQGYIKAVDAVLCTNGYKNFDIRDQAGNKLATLQNHLIPREGYLAGFTDTERQTYAQAFFDDRDIYASSPYFYITHTDQFTIAGGPEFDQPDGVHADEIIAERAVTSKSTYKQFLQKTYNITDCEFSHYWYGIMGYTTSGLRWVGEAPEIKHLWYNLGCNGIGIVTAICAGKRMAALLQGEALPPSLFDIQSDHSL